MYQDVFFLMNITYFIGSSALTVTLAAGEVFWGETYLVAFLPRVA